MAQLLERLLRLLDLAASAGAPLSSVVCDGRQPGAALLRPRLADGLHRRDLHRRRPHVRRLRARHHAHHRPLDRPHRHAVLRARGAADPVQRLSLRPGPAGHALRLPPGGLRRDADRLEREGRGEPLHRRRPGRDLQRPRGRSRRHATCTACSSSGAAPAAAPRSRPRSTASSSPARAATASACASSRACGWWKGRTRRCRSSTSTRAASTATSCRRASRSASAASRCASAPSPSSGTTSAAAATTRRRPSSTAGLARVMLLPLLPLMALPLGMASKRGQRAPGVVFATLALILVHHALQFGESLAANGRAPAGAGRVDALRPVRRARRLDLPRQPGLAGRQPGAARGGRGGRPVRGPQAAAQGEGRCMSPPVGPQDETEVRGTEVFE